MYDVKELEQRLIIIKTSDLDDVTILDENYRELMKKASSLEEKEQFSTLRDLVLRRIDILRSENG